jgi:hypothetical protein
MNRRDVEKAMNLGAGYLAKSQKKDGSFLSSVSALKNFKKSKENQAIFSTCLILSSISNFPEVSKKVKKKTANFLLGQKSDFWSWNYWKRNSAESKRVPYPDDLDVTCCAIAALIMHDPKTIPVKAIASVVNLIAFCESKEGGPYHTWLIDSDAEKSWKDVDLAVNNNIAFFLSFQEVTLPNLIALIEKAIIFGKYASPYYHSSYSVIYFISRWYRGQKKRKIVSFLLKKRLKNYSWGNPLETALAVSALVNFEYEKEKLKKSVDYLVKNQKRGRWKAYPFVIDLIKKDKKYYSGSPELTTAFCLESLGKFLTKNKSIKNKKATKKDSERKKMHKKIINIADQRFSKFNPELNESFLTVREDILKGGETNQITLLPYYFQKSLKASESIEENVLTELGVASLYGWIAYTIYDDFFDEEGDPRLLSLSNICLRELISIYHNIFSKDKIFLEFFQKIMDKIDMANAWETANCRMQISDSKVALPDKFPPPAGGFRNLEKLADRSIGHALGPAAVFYLYEKNIKSSEIKNLILFFENYIIARQLNDDAHDWEDDLKRGQLTPVVVLVLKKYLKRKKHKGLKEIDLKKEISELQKVFWHETIQETCRETIGYVQKARIVLKDISVMKDKSLFREMLKLVEQSAREAIDEQKEMLEFLEGYRK